MSQTKPSSDLPLPLRLLRGIGKFFRRPRASDLKTIALLFVVVTLLTVGALVLLSSAAHAVPLTAGDRIQVTVQSGEEFSGKYQVDVAGLVRLPYAGYIPVAKLEPEAAAEVISARLVSAGLFKRNFARTAVQVLVWAPVDIRVAGAVFYPGAHRINLPPGRERAPERSEDLPGAALPDRRLSDALRAAGGVTPWADVAKVMVRRGDVMQSYDLWGLIQGRPVDDPMLQSGDEVWVASLDQPQAGLVRPSSITPPGIKVFVSNLIVPAESNTAATVGGGSMSFSYGSRFSQAVVAANCVGGISNTSAPRSAVLVRTDRVTGETRHWDSSVETLIRAASDANNPFLLEGDGVACYDSSVTGVRDVFKTLSDIFLPLAVLRGFR